MPESKQNRDELPGAIALGRSLRGWSQRQLAKASGVGQSRISDYERRLKTPTMRSLERIAAALGVSAVDLFELAALARRFRPGGSPAAGSARRPPPPARLRPPPRLGREIAALLAAEAAGAGARASPGWPEWEPDTQRIHDLGRAIALGRSLRGVRREGLAEAAGVGQAALAELERGRKTPAPGSLERIARALGVSAADLFELAEMVGRFRSGGARPAVAAGLGRLEHLERQIAALLAAEAAAAG
jgi:transcriptional regulator with XRE-family HTH domain